MISFLNPRPSSRIRRACQFFAVIALLALWFTIPTGSASAASKPTFPQKLTPNSSFTNGLQNQHAPGRCLDADLNTIANNGTKVQLWDCNGNPQQKWIFTPITPVDVIIQSQIAPNRCLDADLSTIANNGTKVQLWDCNGSPQQIWRVRGQSSLMNLHAPGRCLDADLSTMANNGTKVQLWDCNDSPQQIWNLV